MFSALLSPLVLAGYVHSVTPIAAPPLLANYPWGWGWGYPDNTVIIIDEPAEFDQRVLVEFDAQGQDWGTVWIDGNLVYRAKNFNRRQVVRLRPGSHRLILTGVTKHDIWAAGYLNVGRASAMRVSFSKAGGVYVQNDPTAWLPDRDLKNPIEVWRRYR